MRVWIEFWRIWLILSGVLFASITMVVAVKGWKDLRAMFHGLRSEAHGEDRG